MSDQDFFFDEEDEAPAKPKGGKPAAKPAAKTPPKGDKAAAAPAPQAGEVPFFERSLTMSVAALLVVCGLLVGVIGGILIGQSRATGLAGVPAPAGVNSPGGGTGAGPAPLTQQQMQSGQLPPGHPSVGGAAASGTATPSNAPTGGK